MRRFERMIRRTVVLLAFAGCGMAAAREPSRPAGIAVAYYDADRLYDTLPSLFARDADFLPDGARRWNSERYLRKLANTAAVVDSLGLPLVLLYGIENETVLRELAARCRADYALLHRTMNRLDGLDFGLLYFGDKFFPKYTDCGFGHIYIEGDYAAAEGSWLRIGLVGVCDDRYLNAILAGLRETRPGVRLVVLGRVRRCDAAAAGLQRALTAAETAGRGNARSRHGWYMRDNALVDTAFVAVRGDVYAQRWLFDPQTGAPFATFEGRRYRGGYGSSLPLFIYLRH